MLPGPVVVLVLASLCLSQVNGYVEIVPFHVVTSSANNVSSTWETFPEKKIPKHVEYVGDDAIAVLCTDGVLFFGTLNGDNAVQFSLVHIGGTEPPKTNTDSNIIVLRSTTEHVDMALVSSNFAFSHSACFETNCMKFPVGFPIKLWLFTWQHEIFVGDCINLLLSGPQDVLSICCDRWIRNLYARFSLLICAWTQNRKLWNGRLSLGLGSALCGFLTEVGTRVRVISRSDFLSGQILYMSDRLCVRYC